MTDSIPLRDNISMTGNYDRLMPIWMTINMNECGLITRL